jgi:hypothetical protein
VQRYILRTETVAMYEGTGGASLVTLPSGAVLFLLGHSDPEGLMTVRWNDQNLCLFALDFRERATLVACEICT